MPTIPTILVSDASDEIRTKIESLIKSQSELSFLKTVGKADAEEEIQGASSTIVWIELESGAPEGLELLKKLILANPGSYFVVSKEEIDADLVKKAMQFGALDFLDHRGWAAQIRSVIRRVTTKEWGAQKSQSRVRSAIPNQNIKKSGAWTIPGKQAHKPTAFEANKPKPVAKSEPKPEPKPVPKPEPAPKAESKPEPEPEPIEKPVKKPAPVSVPEPVSKPEPEPEPEPKLEPVSIEQPEPVSEKIEADTLPEVEPLPEEEPEAAFPDEEPAELKESTEYVEPPEPSVEPASIEFTAEPPAALQQEEIPEDSQSTEAEVEAEPEPETVELPAAREEESDDTSAEQMLESLMASAAAEMPQPESEEKAPEKVEEVEKAVSPKPVKKSKWEELDSLISAQRTSQQNVDALIEKPLARKDDDKPSGGIDKETKDALLDAVDNLDAMDSLSKTKDNKSAVKESVWDELDAIVKPKSEPEKEEEKAEETAPVQAFPEESRWGDLDAVTDEVIEASKNVPEEKWGELDSIPTPSTESKSSEDSAKTSGSKWGDLDSIPTPGTAGAASEDIEAVEEKEEEEPKKAGLSVGGAKWGDLDSIPTPSAEGNATEDSVKVSGSKWGDLDSIPTPSAEGNATEDSVKASGSKWGDLDSIPTPGKTGELSKPGLGGIDADSTAVGSTGGGGGGGSMFSGIAGLEDAKLDSDPASPSSLSSAKWGDESGEDSGAGRFGSRTGKLGRTTGSFSQLQSDPNENLVSRETEQSDSGKAEEEEAKPKAMPIPQAQAPNKWTGSGSGSPTAVSSSLKSMDGKKSKPLIQKSDVKVSISPSWMFISYAVASISAILVLFLSFTFYLY